MAPTKAKTTLKIGAVAAVEPPSRKRATKQVLPDDVLSAFRDALPSGAWIGDGASLGTGDDGENAAVSAARITRREVARFSGIEERDIRTRVWSDDDGWKFAVKLRDGVNLPVAA